MTSSESDEDDYFPDDFLSNRHRRLANRVLTPTSTETRPQKRSNRSETRPTRSNSEVTAVLIDDIRGKNPLKLRKNSCDCEACGGEKLGKKMMVRVIPMRDIQKKGARQSGSMGTLNALVNSCRSGSFLIPILGKYRLSAILKPVPNKIYVPPPHTPHLNRLFTEEKLSKSKQNPRKLRLKPISGYTSPRQALRTAAVVTPSTTTSDRLGSGKQAIRIRSRYRAGL